MSNEQEELVKDPYPNLLCQDMEKKLAVWFESKPDAREVFRCGGSVISKKEVNDGRGF